MCAWKIIPIDNQGNELVYGGDDIKKINRYLTGEDLTILDPSDDVIIATPTVFASNAFSILSPTTGFKYIFTGSDIAADRIITLPLMTGPGTMALSSTTTANDWGNNMQTFRHQFVRLMNPANTFGYVLNTGTITAERQLSIPTLTTDDTFVTLAATQTLLNKTLTSPIITAMTINTDTNTIKDSTTNNAGDLLVSNGTKFVRFSRGGANQVPIMNATGTAIIWVDQSALTTGGGGGGGSTGDYLVPTTAGNRITGAWYGTTVTGGSGVFNQFLAETSNTVALNVTDTTGRIGLRWNFTVDDDRGGFYTLNPFVTRLNDPELIVRYKYDPLSASHTSSTSYRVVIGFTSEPFADYGSDGALDAKHAFMWFKETSDSSIGIAGNNGTSTATKNTTVSLTQTDSSVHTVKLFADNINSRWGVSLDNATATYFNFADLPASTARLGCIVQFENEGSDDRSFELYGVTFKAKVI